MQTFVDMLINPGLTQGTMNHNLATTFISKGLTGERIKTKRLLCCTNNTDFFVNKWNKIYITY